MLEHFFNKHREYRALPIRITLGLLLMIDAYQQLALGHSGDLFFAQCFIHLAAAIAILFGFFARFAAIGLTLSLFIFWILAGHMGLPESSLSQMESYVLIVSAALTLMFTGSGKLSLENYFGFK